MADRHYGLLISVCSNPGTVADHDVGTGSSCNRGSWILKEIGHTSSLYLFSHSISGLMEDQESFGEGEIVI